MRNHNFIAARSRSVRLIAMAVATTILLAGLIAPATANAQQAPAKVVIQVPGLYPEGMDYDLTADRYIVGSFVSGDLMSIAPDGTATPFGKAGSNVAGIEIDQSRNRVLAAVAALPNGQAKLAIHDLGTGAQLDVIDLGGLVDEGELFSNDIAVGPDGTAYVTNTGAGVIYAVDLDGNPSIFAEDPRFDAIDGLGLNGIESTGDTLLVGHTTGKIYQIPLDDPSAPTEVAMANPLPGIDGIKLSADGSQLVAVSGGASTVLLLQSGDSWASAQPAGSFATGPNFPTAVAATPDGYQVLYAHLDRLSPTAAPVTEFEIVPVTFGQPGASTGTTNELAFTGAGSTATLALAGAALVTAGLMTVRASRRFDEV